MLGSAVIEVMIGLIFVYILLSLLVMQINQIVANAFKIRAQTLRERVEALIFDNQLQERVLSHPVVGILRPPVTDEETENRRKRTAAVSNLASNAFAKALVNILKDPFLEIYAAVNEVENTEERQHLLAIVNTLKTNMDDPERAEATFNKLYDTVEQLEPAGREDRTAILSTLGPLQSNVQVIQSGNSELLQILNGIQNVENRAFQQTMETVLSGVHSVKEAESAIEEWYDGKMKQTQDMYARYMQTLSLLIGLLLALLLNVDSLHLAQVLWVDDSLREQVNAAAMTALEESNQQDTAEAATPPDAAPDATDDEIVSDEAVNEIIDSYQEAQVILTDLLELNLPIGWTYRTPADNTETALTGRYYELTDDPRNAYNLLPVTSGWYWRIIVKLTGISVTAFAVAQGAPFWFDVLRRIAGQTSPGNTPAEGGATRGQSA